MILLGFTSRCSILLLWQCCSAVAISSAYLQDELEYLPLLYRGILTFGINLQQTLFALRFAQLSTILHHQFQNVKITIQECLLSFVKLLTLINYLTNTLKADSLLAYYLPVHKTID
jgi:hypothetical protein